jgi:nucleoid-associated protein YgaU
MNPGQPTVSPTKTVTVVVRAGAALCVALVALAASFSAQAATDRNEAFPATAMVGDGAFHWIDATSADTSVRLADADAVPPAAPVSRPAKTGNPHDAEGSPGSRDLIGKIQDWLARANRAYQTTIIPRLSTPSPDADAVARKREQIKEEEARAKAAEAAKRAEEAQQAEAARKAAEEAQQAEAARKAAEEVQQAEAARKAAEEAKQAEAARKAAEEAQRAEAARKSAEEAKQAEAARKAAEDAKQAEAARKAAEEAKQAEAARKAAEEAKQAEAARKAAEEAKQAEAARKAAEEAKQAEAARTAAEEAKQAEAARKAAEEAKQVEAARKAAEEAKQAEAARKATEEPKLAAQHPPTQSVGREGEVAVPPPSPIPEPGSMQAQKLPGAVLRPEPAAESDSDLKETEPPQPVEIRQLSPKPAKKESVRRWVRRERSCRLAGRHIRPPGYYTVHRGDSLWRISRYYYRRGWFYHRLYHANRRIIRDPDLIFPCQRIFVPRRR